MLRRCLLLLLLPAWLLADPPLEGYSDYAALSARVAELEGLEGVSVSSLGRSLEGREIHLLTIGGAEPDARPAVCVVGNVHAPQLVGSELALRLAEQLGRRAAAEPQLRELLKHFTVYVIPRPHPDASEAFFADLQQERSGNARPQDDDRDGRLDEDAAEDLDGDGAITWMRVYDPAGDLRGHPADSSVLVEVRRHDGEQGSFRLLPEGLDNDGDGRFNEDGPGGVDFNRNLTWSYPYFEAQAGPHQVSERETRAVLDFLYARPNIASVVCFAPQDNLMHPWKADRRKERDRIITTLLSDDAPYSDHVAEAYRELLGGKDAPEAAGGSGSFVHWAYFHYGRFSFGARAWWVPQVAPDSTEVASDDDRGADTRNLKRYLQREGLDGWADWTEVAHPDFPGRRVEVGGERPFFRWNPPADTLDALAAKHLDFVLRLEELRPRLTVELEAEALGGGLFELRARVRNEGYLPTMSAMGERSRQMFPLMAELALPEGAVLFDGSRRRTVARLDGSGGQRELRWLLRSASGLPLSIAVASPAVGEASTTITLP